MTNPIHDTAFGVCLCSRAGDVGQGADGENEPRNLKVVSAPAELNNAARRRGETPGQQWGSIPPRGILEGYWRVMVPCRMLRTASRLNRHRAAKTSPDPQSGAFRSSVLHGSSSKQSCSTGRISLRDTVRPTPEFNPPFSEVAISPNPAGKDRDACCAVTIPVAPHGDLPQTEVNRGDGNLGGKHGFPKETVCPNRRRRW